MLVFKHLIDFLFPLYCLSCKKKDSPLKIQHPGVLLPHQRHAHGLALEQGGKGGVVRFPV